MHVVESTKGDVTVVEISGRVMGGEEVTNLCSTMKGYVTTGSRHLVLDLANVEWMNSCGLGMLVGVHVSATNAGGRFALVNVDNIRQLLNTTRLIEVLDVFDSREEALTSFKAEQFD